MPNIIDKTLFVLELDIPTNNQNVETALTAFIAKYQPVFCKGIMGVALYGAWNVNPTAAGRMQTLTDLVKPMLADFVYFKYMNDRNTPNTGVGATTPKTENSKKVNNIDKSVSAMRDCKKLMVSYFDFMKQSEDYPEFDRNCAIKFYQEEISGINTLNI